MDISITQNNGKKVFSLRGRLDTTTAPQLQNALIPAFDIDKDIELDFTELAYISSAGLRLLLTGEKTAAAKGGKMTLTNVSPDIMEIFTMTGFAGMLRIV